MGFFGKKKGNAAVEPGAFYAGGMKDGTLPVVVTVVTEDQEDPWASSNVPVATPIDAHCVAASQQTCSAPIEYDHPNPSVVQQNQSVIYQPPQYADPRNTSARPSASSTVPRGVIFTRHPCILPECPHCHCESRTKVITYPNLMTWFAALVLLVVFWPIFCIPLLLEQTKQTDHYCALCQNQVGSVMPFSDCCQKVRR